MIGERVDGWCLIWDDQQIPDLMKCDVERSGTERYFILTSDDGFRSVLTFGETFFFHKLPALNMLVYRLEEARRGHQEAVEYIASQARAAQEEFTEERAKDTNGTEG